MLWKTIARPILFRLEAEQAHHLSMSTFNGLSKIWPVAPVTRKLYACESQQLEFDLFGLRFINPVGLAAGFDKNAAWFPTLANLGFGHIEVGTLTAHPQSGNPKPRLFRLPRDLAIINRMGFNNIGSQQAAENLKSTKRKSVLGINIGKSKITPLEDAADDYLTSLKRLYRFADYFTINVSSPNTPGLRQLQDRHPLADLLEQVVNGGNELAATLELPRVPIFLKIAPELGDRQLDDIVDIVTSLKVDGIVATNTTIKRDNLKTPDKKIETIGAGGLSGKPLTRLSRQVVSYLFRKLDGKIPIIGVGGVMSGEDAWQLICAGATLVQVYTGFVYEGPAFAKQINRHILQQLNRHNLSDVRQAVGRNISS